MMGECAREGSPVKRWFLLTLIAVLGCTAFTQQKAQNARFDQSSFKNLKVLPQNITHDELEATMHGFTRGLGVHCDHCHARINERELDFASDEKPEKNTARLMLQMTRDLNARYISKVNAHGNAVTCATCHRGESVPQEETDLPDPAQLPPGEKH